METSNNIPSLQETIFINHIEDILSHKKVPTKEPECNLKNTYLQLYMHLDSWIHIPQDMEKIREYRNIYMKKFNDFYKTIKKIRTVFMEVAPNIGNINFIMIPSINTLIQYYNKNYILQWGNLGSPIPPP
jgi:DNA-directed RNA polymerase beta' subunit